MDSSVGQWRQWCSYMNNDAELLHEGLLYYLPPKSKKWKLKLVKLNTSPLSLTIANDPSATTKSSGEREFMLPDASLEMWETDVTPVPGQTTKKGFVPTFIWRVVLENGFAILFGSNDRYEHEKWIGKFVYILTGGGEDQANDEVLRLLGGCNSSGSIRSIETGKMTHVPAAAFQTALVEQQLAEHPDLLQKIQDLENNEADMRRFCISEHSFFAVSNSATIQAVYARIIKGLKFNIGVKAVELEQTFFTDDIAALFADMLRENTHITHLLLAGNLMSQVGLCALIDTLKVNKTLRVLEIDGQEVDVEGSDAEVALKAVMSKNNYLTELSMDISSPSTESYVAECLDRNLQKNGRPRKVL